MNGKTMTMHSMHVFQTDLGWIALTWNEELLTRVAFGHPSAASAIASLEADHGFATTSASSVPAWIRKLTTRLQSYAAGHDETFDDVPLDLTHLSAFQNRVVRSCRRIARGKVRTYGELATAAGSTGAARAVGNVMAQNRYPIIIPCHRVVGSAGCLGGFSARDGISMKRRMLEMEGAELKKSGRNLAKSAATSRNAAKLTSTARRPLAPSLLS
jgi:methylated-DNA-[protein]-cysteine S-methyltransferase